MVQWLAQRIQSEPNTLSELVRQFMYLLLGFQIIQWTDAQQGLVLAFVSGLLTFLVRGRVVPMATIDQAGGLSTQQIKANAATNVAAKAAAEDA